MADKPFIRVKDKNTKHEYDIHRQAFKPEKHEALDEKRYPPVSSPRRPKHFVNLRSDRASKPTTDDAPAAPDSTASVS